MPAGRKSSEPTMLLRGKTGQSEKMHYAEAGPTEWTKRWQQRHPILEQRPQRPEQRWKKGKVVIKNNFPKPKEIVIILLIGID